jgi:uncharacterized membrane protein YjjB (DUF3815 family)
VKEPLGLLWAALGASGFAVLFDLRLREVPFAAAGAAGGWWLYSAVGAASSEAAGYFAAAAFIGLYAEVVASLRKRPAAIYIVSAILPIVPGGGMYYTMLNSVRGDLYASLGTGFETLQAAGAIAAGLAVSSALSRLVSLDRLARRLKGKA